MSTQIIRHTGYSQSSGVNFVGGGSMGDQSDSSWAQHIGSSQTWTASDMADYSMAGDERVLSVQLAFRADSGFGNVVTNLFPEGAGASTYDGFGNVQGLADRYGQVRPSNTAGNEWTQGDINALRVWVLDQGYGGTKPRVTEVWAIIELRHKPTLSVSGPTGTNPGGTRKPTSTWAFTANDSETQSQYQVVVYSEAQYTAGGFTPFSSASVYDSGVANGNGSSFTIPVDLADGNYRSYVRAAKTFRSAAWWADYGYTSFTINDTPPLPTNVTPNDGGTVQTDLVTLGATINGSPLATNQHIEWNLALDAGFTSSLRSLVGTESKLSGPTTQTLVNANRLTQATWYVRARQVDSTGKASGWSATQTLIVSHPASATNLSPTNDVTLTYPGGGVVTLDWDFSDPAPEGDSQTAYQWIVERADTGALVQDSGKVTSTATTATVTIAIGLKDVPLRWRVRLYDTDDKTAGYTTNSQFRLSDVPAVSITYPTDGGTVNTPTPYVEWVTTLTGGRTQSFYKIQIFEVGSGLSVYDSGFLGGANQNYNVPSPVLRNNIGYTLTVTVKDNTGLANSNSVPLFTAIWDTPVPVHAGAALQYMQSQGHVRVFWFPDDYEVDGAFVRYNVYRRNAIDDLLFPVQSSGWTLIGTVDEESPYYGVGSYSFNDYLVPVSTPVQYAVTQVAIRFGIEVESYLPYENRVQNNSFEEGIGTWGEYDPNGLTHIGGDPDLSIEHAGAPEGSNYLKLETTHTNYAVARNEPSPDHDFPVCAGETLVVRDRWLEIVNNTSHYLMLFVSGSGILQSQTDSNPGVGTWRINTFQAQIPPNVGATIAGIFAGVSFANPVTTGAIGIDNIEVFATAATYTAESTDYWLIDIDNRVALRLNHVTADSFTDEYEEETEHLIGRGRHVQFGDRLGYTGSLTGEFWDYPGDFGGDDPAMTAREQRLRLELLKMNRNVLHLRNPFGDVFKVSAGNIQMDRIPGVGQREYGTFTIPYQEVV